jgi:hypothetical protein
MVEESDVWRRDDGRAGFRCRAECRRDPRSAGMRRSGDGLTQTRTGMRHVTLRKKLDEDAGLPDDHAERSGLLIGRTLEVRRLQSR